jgi:hypothetical protein
VETRRAARVAVAAYGVIMSIAAADTTDVSGDAPVRVAAAPRTPGSPTSPGVIGAPSNIGAPSSTVIAPSQSPPAPAPPAATKPTEPPTPFQLASSKYQGGHQAEALAEFQQLAEQGDARAQYLLALDLIEGKYVPRNVSQGFAWLLLACEDKKFGDFVAGKAREARTVIEPQLSGPDLIHADGFVAQYRQRHPQ